MEYNGDMPTKNYVRPDDKRITVTTGDTELKREVERKARVLGHSVSAVGRELFRLWIEGNIEIEPKELPRGRPPKNDIQSLN